MHRETFIAKLTEIQQNVGQLLAELQASKHDGFAAHLYRSRREYRCACQRAGKGGKQIERCVISRVGKVPRGKGNPPTDRRTY
jgi:hypothetical protein